MTSDVQKCLTFAPSEVSRSRPGEKQQKTSDLLENERFAKSRGVYTPFTHLILQANGVYYCHVENRVQMATLVKCLLRVVAPMQPGWRQCIIKTREATNTGENGMRRFIFLIADAARFESTEDLERAYLGRDEQEWRFVIADFVFDLPAFSAEVEESVVLDIAIELGYGKAFAAGWSCDGNIFTLLEV